MITAQDIKKILDDAVFAPSGENCQPWRFEVKDSILYVINDPVADLSVYNFELRGSFIAHGALIENISILASESGYDAKIVLFPDNTNADLVASIEFKSADDILPDPLSKFIRTRCTNRKAYSGKTLSADIKYSLRAAVKLPENEVSFIDEPEKMKVLGVVAALNEKILFENKSLHDFFYSHILWDESSQDATGFYYKTLEFLPHQLPLVKLLKNWKILDAMNRYLGISRVIAKDNAKKYAGSGTFFALTMPDTSRESFIGLGRSFQRFWLASALNGLALQPCTGVLFFEQRIKSGDNSSFTDTQVNEIEAAHVKMTETFFPTNEVVVGMFGRIGYADSPSGRATRRSPEVTFK